MALREFADEHGRGWTVWDVYPSRNIEPRRQDLDQPEIAGWLAFESTETGERRRLMPVPMDWVTRSDVELRGLWIRAVPVSSKRRLIE
jgi:hypothetical protein